MKKKFLSLMMAAAVVATTSVSAFAQSGEDQVTTPAENNVQVTTPDKANITVKDNEEPTHDIDITGNIQNDDGKMPTTSFKVTIPTAANFTVNNQGVLVGPGLTVKNEGTQGIDVYAHDFSKTGNGSIKVVSENDISSQGEPKPRSTVSLKLVVDGKDKAFLAAGDGKSGVYEQADLDEASKKTEGVQLLSLDPAANNVATTKKIKIEGEAGKARIGANPISDTFQLVLKIKKSGNR